MQSLFPKSRFSPSLDIEEQSLNTEAFPLKFGFPFDVFILKFVGLLQPDWKTTSSTLSSTQMTSWIWRVLFSLISKLSFTKTTSGILTTDFSLSDGQVESTFEPLCVDSGVQLLNSVCLFLLNFLSFWSSADEFEVWLFSLSSIIISSCFSTIGIAQLS